MDVEPGGVFCAVQHFGSEEASGTPSFDIPLFPVRPGPALFAALVSLGTVWNPGIEFSPTTVAAILYLGIGPSLLAYLCWNESVAIIGPTRAAFVYYCLPLFSGGEAFLLLGESITAVHILSGTMILVELSSPHENRQLRQNNRVRNYRRSLLEVLALRRKPSFSENCRAWTVLSNACN